jgi:hypothetical protein
MSPDGRTYWYMTDAAWLRRELIGEIGAEHGPAGPLALVYLQGEAKAANAGGIVSSGYGAVARGTFTTAPLARKVIASAVALGLLVDFSEDADGRRFSACIAGWAEDQARGHKQGRNKRYEAKVRTEANAAELAALERLKAQQDAEDAAKASSTFTPTIGA